MSAIFKKELRVAFGGMFGFAVTAILLFFMSAFTVVFNLLSGYPDFSYPLVAMHWVLVVLIPFMTMRSVAEERHSRSDRLLYSLPIRMHRVVLGKYFAMLVLFLIPTAVAALYPLILSFFGELSLIGAYTCLLGYILLGGALIAICMFVSSLVENQILAAVLSLAAMLLLYFSDTLATLLPSGAALSFLICVLAAIGIGLLLWRVSRVLLIGASVATVLTLTASVLYLIDSEKFVSLVPNLITSSALFARFGGFVGGFFDLSACVLYLGTIGFFLYLTYVSMEKRRWL